MEEDAFIMQVFIDAIPFLIEAWQLILDPTVLVYLLL